MTGHWTKLTGVAIKDGKPTLATLRLDGCAFRVEKSGFEAYAEIAGE